VSWTYGYDNRNELVQAKEFDASSALVLEADYKYDVYGNRIEQDVTQSGVTTVQRYALDGWNPAKSNPVGNEDFDVRADLDGSNNLETRYLRGDNIDQILGRVDVSGSSGTAYWTLTDSQGSVRDVIDNTGAVKDSIVYDAFGNITTEYDATYRGRYAWTGRELDVETGLQYNRARYYDSTTGRWISQDPMGFDAGDSNLYRYANNNAPNATDPAGLQQQMGPQIGYSINGVLKATIRPNLGGDTAKTFDINKTFGAEVFKGKLVISPNALITPVADKKLPGSTFIAYQGTNAKDVRFIQIMRIMIQPVMKNKNGFTLGEPVDAAQIPSPADPAITYRTTTKDGSSYYVDVASGYDKMPWYNNPGAISLMGGFQAAKAKDGSDGFSWIGDYAGAAAINAEYVNTRVPLKQLGQVANIVNVEFNTFAISVSTNKVLQQVNWSTYASVGVFNNGNPIKVGATQTPFTLDGKSHALVLGSFAPPTTAFEANVLSTLYGSALTPDGKRLSTFGINFFP
jgi:RHS repeat-associated protein